MIVDPTRLDTPITTQGNSHAMTSIHHFEPTICGRHFIHRNQNRQMLDILDMGVRISVNMGIEPPTPGEFVVDFLFKKDHLFAA